MTKVLGRNVRGEITRNRERRVDQWTGKKFLEYLDALLNLDKVDSVKWKQYTPYFNDGDACIFSLHGVYVRLVDGDPESGDNSDGYIGEYDMRDYPERDFLKWVTKHGLEEVHEAFINFENNMEHFEDFLEESFGDHATVIATRDGFDIEFYEHD